MDKLKEILFGFIVIAALGIIFVPMLFNDEGRSEHVVKDIPQKPVVKKAVEPQVEPKALTELKENKPKPIESAVVKQPVQEEVKRPAVTLPATKTESTDQMIATAKPVTSAPAPAPAPAQPASAAAVAPASTPVPAAPPAPPKSNIVVPPAPETPVEPKKPEEKVESVPASALPVETTHEHESSLEEAPKPAKKAKSKAEKGWVVQVGTFAVHENAVRLAKKLKRDGFPAYTKSVYRQGRNLTLVFVGPHSQQEAAVETQFAIESQYGLRGEVLHFSPSGSRIKEDD